MHSGSLPHHHVLLGYRKKPLVMLIMTLVLFPLCQIKRSAVKKAYSVLIVCVFVRGFLKERVNSVFLYA